MIVHAQREQLLAIPNGKYLFQQLPQDAVRKAGGHSLASPGMFAQDVGAEEKMILTGAEVADGRSTARSSGPVQGVYITGLS